MLFNLAPLEDEIEKQVESGKWKVERKAEWKALLDWLRVNGLMRYWMCEEYHDAAVEELKKVNWSKQPKSVRRQYKMPRWVLKAKRHFMRVGSWCKQRLLFLR